MATAKHRAIDRLRRRAPLERKHDELARELDAGQEIAAPDLDAALGDDQVGDDLPRLVFVACHPVLPTEARDVADAKHPRARAAPGPRGRRRQTRDGKRVKRVSSA